MPVLYPFGHGLSYTQFELTDLAVDYMDFTPEDPVRVSLTVKNIGDRTGSEVVQLYVRDVESRAARPVKELKAFQKVRLAPSEEMRVTLELNREAFSFYSPSRHRWVAENGDFEILVGTSSRNILLTQTIHLHGGDRAFLYDEMTPLVWFVRDEKFLKLIETEFPDKMYLFRQETLEWLCLLIPLPFYKMSEPYMGFPLLTKEEVQYILKRMNE